MPCFKPICAWYSRDVNPSGKRSLVFSREKANEPDSQLEIACGQCVGCRLERSRQWAVRCMHEASLYDNNCFLTLTFSPEELRKRDNPWSLDVKDFQKFMKRLRKKYGNGIRFFHCGEYGDINNRPHYHACIFNHDFEDKVFWKMAGDNRLYISDSLSELWPYGFSTIGDVTFKSAAYVARYIMKKVTGSLADNHYVWCDEDTGELFDLKPEYTTMSRRPGIGKEWFDKFSSDVYPDDFVVVNGKKVRPPKYYDRILEEMFPINHEEVKQEREIRGRLYAENNTEERLQVREKVQLAKASKLPRNLNEDS